MIYGLVKRVIDVVVAVLALVVGFPLFVGVAVLVRLRLGSPVLFRQVRPGLQGRSFTLYKFRTMIGEKEGDPDGTASSDDDRLTSFGRFLRSTSLDELPELWNVLLGHMSLVGPRPLLMEYLPRYSPAQARRHVVKPGITGWAQVNGRNALSWDEKFTLDVWYVDHRCFLLDLKILAMTAAQLVRREGISQPGQATMEKFIGSGTQERG